MLWHAAGPDAEALLHFTIAEAAGGGDRDDKWYPYVGMDLTSDTIQVYSHSPLPRNQVLLT